MYLRALTLQNIKGINDLHMEFSTLSGWHVLIGDNGTGKSTILKEMPHPTVWKELIRQRTNGNQRVKSLFEQASEALNW